MEKKLKKDELIAALAKKEKAVEEFVAADETKRKALSQFLDSPWKKRGQYDYSNTERITYTWPEIYFSLGKLVAKRDHLSLIDRLNAIEAATFQNADQLRVLKEHPL